MFDRGDVSAVAGVVRVGGPDGIGPLAELAVHKERADLFSQQGQLRGSVDLAAAKERRPEDDGARGYDNERKNNEQHAANSAR